MRASFRLAELLPVDESIEQERENLSAPSIKLMQTVAAAIREDLAKVKDVLDIFVRRGAGQPQELASQVEMLRKIGDTLGVLGLGELRSKVQVETERLGKIVDGTVKADESMLVDIAATLIGVEDRLDDGLVGLILPKDAAVEQPGEDSEFQQVQAAVLRECIVNLARIKEAVTQSVGGTLDAAGLDSWQDLMRGMKAGLLLLGKPRAVDVIEGITQQLKRVMQPGRARAAAGVHRPPGRCDRQPRVLHGDAAGRAQRPVVHARQCAGLRAGARAAGHPVGADGAAAGAGRLRQDRADQHHRDARRPVAPGCWPRWMPPRRPSPPRLAPKLPALAEHADPELVKLFIEEAHEELAKIRHNFPVWDENPLERDSLVTVRRSLHTLKGSGRMVGARDLGEFAWSIENLVNRVLDNTLTRSPAIVETLRAAVAALPELITQLENGTPVRADMAGISSRAHALAAGRPSPPARTAAEDIAATGTQRTTTTVPPLPAAPAASPPAPAAPAKPAVTDDTLRDIYARETATHVATVRAYLAREAPLPEPHPLPEEVYRACHTLSGSSKMAQARHGIRLAEPLDHWLRRAFSSGLGLATADLALLGDCMAAMESVATHLDESTGYFVNHWQLLERIERADKSLDARIAAEKHAAQAQAQAAETQAATAAGARKAPPSLSRPRASRSTSIRKSPPSSPTRPPS